MIASLFKRLDFTRRLNKRLRKRGLWHLASPCYTLTVIDVTESLKRKSSLKTKRSSRSVLSLLRSIELQWIHIIHIKAKSHRSLLRNTRSRHVYRQSRRSAILNDPWSQRHSLRKKEKVKALSRHYGKPHFYFFHMLAGFVYFPWFLTYLCQNRSVGENIAQFSRHTCYTHSMKK